MSRLVVDAVNGEPTGADVVGDVIVTVSVSRADDGSPVTGLTTKNFRVASTIGLIRDFKISSAYELAWEPGDVDLSGCYSVEILQLGGVNYVEGQRYGFGIQVRTFSGGRAPTVVDQGQTIVEVISTGK